MQQRQLTVCLQQARIPLAVRQPACRGGDVHSCMSSGLKVTAADIHSCLLQHPADGPLPPRRPAQHKSTQQQHTSACLHCRPFGSRPARHSKCSRKKKEGRFNRCYPTYLAAEPATATVNEVSSQFDALGLLTALNMCALRAARAEQQAPRTTAAGVVVFVTEDARAVEVIPRLSIS